MPDASRRYQRSRKSLTLDYDKLAQRIVDDYTTDLTDRTDWNDRRTQLYAKLRGWLEDKEFPWRHAANQHPPIMMQDSLRVQDSIYNAVMTSLPPITAKADHAGDQAKEARVDNLIYTQLFRELNGERLIAEFGDSFVNDGVMVGYVPWVREAQTIADLHVFDPVPDDQTLAEYVRPLIEQMFQDAEEITKEDDDGWSWTVELPDEERGQTRKVRVECYIPEAGGRVEMVEVGDRLVFDGPVPQCKSIEDYTVPFRASNPQPPGPANPGGARHVILIDTPSFDELARLQKSKYYDLLTTEDLEKFKAQPSMAGHTGEQNEQLKQIKDDFEGTQSTTTGGEKTPTLTRLTWFGGMDVNDDGLEEQVVVRIIKETKTVLRARLLTEEYPAYPPRRPLMAQSFIPVKDRWYGISLLELLEPLYDMMKMQLDQGVDAGTIRNLPWGLVKSHSGLRNEPIRISPGLLHPSPTPKDDLFIPQFPNTGDAWTINLLTIYSQWADQLSMIGELNFGQVPAGRSAALRTTQNMQSVLQQGDARPEHLLRRFFAGLAEIWSQVHELNQAFLPKQKELRMIGVPQPGEDVYQTIADRSQIQGRFQFEFKPSVLHTSKALLQQDLLMLLQILINPITIQMEIVTRNNAYHLLRDTVKSRGHDADRYLTAPEPDLRLARVSAPDALTMILQNQMPEGVPAEPAQEHLEQVQALLDSPDFVLIRIEPMQQQLLNLWIKRVGEIGQKEAQQAQLMQAAQQFQQTLGNGGAGGANGQGAGARPAGTSGNAPVSPNELLNESLPGAGGGGNA